MTQIDDKNFYKGNEQRYMKEKGWLTNGTAAGTYKLTTKGIAQAKRILEALDAESKTLIKLLFNTKHTQSFTGDGSAKTFTLEHKPIEVIISVKVNGVKKDETTDWTVAKSTGVVTFVAAPANASTVEIIYREDNSGNEDDVKQLM